METRVTIIGGGLAGVFTAIFLAQVRDKKGKCVYQITLIESNKDLLQGASMILARLHHGGEYCTDSITARQCLIGAFLFAQAVPSSVFSSVPGIDYLISKENNNKEFLTKCLFDEHAKSRALYSKLYTTAKLYAYESPLGHPDNLYRILSEKELPPNMAGGVRTNELGFNSENLNIFLRELTTSMPPIKIITNTKILSARAIPGGYELGDSLGGRHQADLVVNTAWENAWFLNRQISRLAIMPNTYLRAFGVADIQSCPYTRPAFVLMNQHGGMFSPVDDEKAIVYAPVTGISHVATLPSTAGSIPSWWFDHQHTDSVKEKLYGQIVRLFPQLASMTIEDIFFRPTISYDKQLHRRRDLSPHQLTKNWYSVTPTKGTFAVWSALRLVELLHPELLEGFNLKNKPIVPGRFCLVE